MRKGNNMKIRVGVAGVAMGLAMLVPVSVAAAPSAKVMVKDTGFYRVTKAQLASVMGMTESNVAATALSVMNMGRVVPSIRDNGDVVFYGHRFVSQYTDENVYVVEQGTAVAPASQTVSAGTSPFAGSFNEIRRAENQVIFRADIIRTPGQETEDPIYWRLISSGLSTSNFNATVALSSVAPATGGSLKIRVKGATDIAGRYYHRARVLLNNTLLGTVDFEGLDTAEATFTVPSGLFTSGNNTVRVQSNPPPGTTFDSFYLDYLEANYARLYVAQTNRLNMDVVSGSTEISSLNSSNVLLWNVTDPWSPKSLVGYGLSAAGTNNKVNFSTTLTGRYAIVRLGSELAPFRLATGSVVNLKSPTWHLDHLTITEPGLLAEAQAIKNHRIAQGLLAELVSIDDVYDNFNFGIRDPRALQSFLGYAYRTWSKYPNYVFLVGDGSLDYKNNLGAADSGIPSFPVVVSGGMYASDYAFGDIDNDGYVEIAVGRLPVNAASNLTQFVQKMINYETGGQWRTNTMITTDLSDFAGDFYGDGNYLETSFVDREVHRADMDLIGANATRDELIEGVNLGKEVTVYIGHGTPNQLSLQSIILTTDSVLFTNDAAPSTFLMIGCLVGSFANPAFTSMGESLIKAKGGAASLVAAATLISAADGRVLTEEFLDTLYTEGESRIGDAWIKGKNQLTLTGRAPAYKAFQLMGDPGMAVGDPQAPAEAPGQPGRGTFEEWVTWAIPPVLLANPVGPNPSDDPDGDRFDNWSEYMAGTDPMDINSFLEIVEIRRGANPNDKIVSWPSSNSRTYRLEYATNIKGPYFLVDTNIPATVPVNSYTTVASSDTFFYRVVVE